MLRVSKTAAALVAALLVAPVGCGGATSTAEPEDATSAEPSGGSEPVTARALGAVAAEYAGTPDSGDTEEDAAEELGRGAVGAELRFGSDGEYDGDALTVAVGPGPTRGLLDCDGRDAESLDGCVRTDQGVLAWEAEEPEEDPGVVYLLVDKDDGAALLFYSGPTITGDPRELDLPIGVDDLFAIGGDPRVDVTTSPEAVAAGAALSWWRESAG
jgi:hypothetical protein